MQNSGTKLVLILIIGALLLGTVSWWYRFEAAHRASQFWGPQESRLIAESEGLEAVVFEPIGSEALATLGWEALGEPSDLSKVRGQAHLRHALLSDRNYLWKDPIDAGSMQWRWCFRFFEEGQDVYAVLSDDLTAIGKFEPGSDSVAGYYCEPMSSSLKQYFAALKLLPDSKPPASTSTE